ncbi:FAD:protein FMN transferase [Bernardetia sp. Wsw4-3y2]|uniref:FAD:protein FMN transferase n=1 Tax=Bernardetia sp. Wsw4-3y2 TaxID=3127471 RepID=UPI0030CB6064
MLYRRATKLMGNGFEIALQSQDKIWANTKIDVAIDEIKRIERLLTTFAEDSITNQINNNAGIKPIQIPDEVFQLIARCQRISDLTQGAFDISYGGFDKRFWNFDLSMKELPSVENAKQAVRLINYQNIILDKENQSVFLKNKGMRIGFGGIGKGYAAEKAKQILKANGVESGFVNAAGDLTTWGFQENGKPWTIGIADPNQGKKLFSSLNITNTSVATSGNYEKFVMIKGKRYSHTIDPKTGFPVSGIKSVTIITANAELADALATPITVMGIKTGLHLINQMKGVGCLIIDDNNKLFLSKNITIDP